MRKKQINDLKVMRVFLLSLKESKENVNSRPKVKVLTKKRYVKEYRVA